MSSIGKTKVAGNPVILTIHKAPTPKEHPKTNRVYQDNISHKKRTAVENVLATREKLHATQRDLANLILTKSKQERQPEEAVLMGAIKKLQVDEASRVEELTQLAKENKH